MTEPEWHSEAVPGKLFKFLRQQGDPSDRKSRLFGVVFCRRAVAALSYYVFDPVVDGCERYADDPDGVSLDLLSRSAEPHFNRFFDSGDDDVMCHRELAMAVYNLTNYQIAPDLVADQCMNAICGHDDYYAGRGEMLFQTDFLRDIFGNPFRPVAFAPEWRSSAAVALADAMYQSRDFGPMPVLADALEEAGCANPDILSHCRGDGPHVRGCWVVDLVLGRA